MSRALAALTLSFTLARPSAAQQSPPKTLASCVAIPNDTARLACYDALAGRSAAPVPQPRAGTGAWVVKDTVDPMNDNRLVTMYLVASSGTSTTGYPVVLALRCKDQKTEVLVAWRSFISDEGGSVTMRVGSAPAETARWHISGDNTGTFYPKDAAQLIQQLVTVDRLVLQTTPYNENPITAVFDLTGLPNALPPLRAACGW